MTFSALLILQYFSVVLTAIFAAIALTKDRRSPDGRLNKWGQFALVGIGTSTLVSLAVLTIKEINATKSSLKNQTAIERGLYPITTVTGTATFLVDDGNETVRPYLDWLFTQLGKDYSENAFSPFLDASSASSIQVFDGVVNKLCVSPDSPLFPSTIHQELSTLLSFVGLRFMLFSSENEDFQRTLDAEKKLTLVDDGLFSYSIGTLIEGLEMCIDLLDAKVRFNLNTEIGNPISQDRKPRMVGLPDLSGAAMTVELQWAGGPDRDVNVEVEMAARAFILDQLKVTFGPTGELTLIRSDFDLVDYKAHGPIYMHRFPLFGSTNDFF